MAPKRKKDTAAEPYDRDEALKSTEDFLRQADVEDSAKNFTINELSPNEVQDLTTAAENLANKSTLAAYRTQQKKIKAYFEEHGFCTDIWDPADFTRYWIAWLQLWTINSAENMAKRKGQSPSGVSSPRPAAECGPNHFRVLGFKTNPACCPPSCCCH
mmetsp:Transcript_23306/g.64392  ORF Transcript_23306/g.64392 Transcript_23306/m.64392 type:complete len:158 (+) Transcript_23306:90-563(+)